MAERFIPVGSRGRAAKEGKGNRHGKTKAVWKEGRKGFLKIALILRSAAERPLIFSRRVRASSIVTSERARLPQGFVEDYGDGGRQVEAAHLRVEHGYPEAALTVCAQ